MGITKTIFLHALGSIYEIGTGQSFTQRVLLPALLRKVKAQSVTQPKPRQPASIVKRYVRSRRRDEDP